MLCAMEMLLQRKLGPRVERDALDLEAMSNVNGDEVPPRTVNTSGLGRG
jgi:hypothetical protein